jgi:hypothetical protein
MPALTPSSLETLSNHELVRSLETLLSRERQLEADVLVHLGEIDARRLHLEEGYSSLFRYCTEHLHFSEAVVYDRIGVARKARAFPALLERIRSADLHLTGARLLAPHLTPENHQALLDRARHRTKREIEEIVADLVPKPAVRGSVRKLPSAAAPERRPPAEPTGAPPADAPASLADGPMSLVDAPMSPTDKPASLRGRTTASLTAGQARTERVGGAPAAREAADQRGRMAASVPSSSATATHPRARPEPLGNERYKVQFAASRTLCDKLREAQALLGHQIPDGDLAEIFGRALDLLLEDAKRKKFARTSSPRRRDRRENESERASSRPSRHIPARIKRAVAERDAERCSFVARSGRRCNARERLEFHHLEPWARCHTHSVDRVALRCRAHNGYAAEQDFGRDHMERCRHPSRGRSTRTGTSSHGAVWGS